MEPTNPAEVAVDPTQVAQVLGNKIGQLEYQLAMEAVARQQLLQEKAQLAAENSQLRARLLSQDTEEKNKEDE
jgi:regulator of replication initiation timing